MRASTENDLNALSAAILGILGGCLLLIPSHLDTVFSGIPIWAMALLGVCSFMIFLSAQIFFVLNFYSKCATFIQRLSAFFLFIFAALFMRAELAVDGILFSVVGVVQLALTSPLKVRSPFREPIRLTSLAASFSVGIFLALSGERFADSPFFDYKIILAIGFLVSAVISAFSIFPPSNKFGNFLSLLTIIPWLAWGVFSFPNLSISTLFAPVLLIAAIIFSGFLHWDKISLTNEDFLGRRVLMIASTLELALLIFLGALLALLDYYLDMRDSFLITARTAAFIFFVMTSLVIHYEVVMIIMALNMLMHELSQPEDERERSSETRASSWNNRLSRYIKPFMLSRNGLRIRLIAQGDQIKLLEHQLENEKKRNNQFTLLLELSQQLENQLDQPVAAQLTVNTLERALKCSLVSLYVHEAEQKEFMLLAAAGEQTNMVPAGYRQDVTAGVIGRAVRQRKTQIIHDIKADPDYIFFENEPNRSAVVIPLIYNGHANGTIVLNSLAESAFGSIEIALAEAAAAELTRAWERSGYQQRLTNLVQTGSQLSSMVEPESTAREVASIAKGILKARLTFVHIQLGQERNYSQTASSGDAPRLLESLQNPAESDALMQMAFQAIQPFRVRDIRKYNSTAHLSIDHPNLRSMIVIPIRWHRINIGAIFAFGKQNEVFFTGNDESLAELLSIQTAGAFESAWLQQELRASLRITSLLYRLSNQIIQAENLDVAASDIAQTAHKLAKSMATGIVLFDAGGNLMAELSIDSAGIQHTPNIHPMNLIQDAMTSGQLIQISLGQSTVRTCMPIKTPFQKYGAIWMDAPEDHGHKPTANSNDLQALVNQAAIALERSLLLAESQRQAIEIKAAYDKLEATYDQTLTSLMSALDARDRETEGHSSRVARLVAKLGEALGFSTQHLKVLERGSLLHDIGKIGISDTILHKPGPLSEEEWGIMRLHPDIGAKIVEGIPFLEETIPLIRHHQERWDGSGYPAGLRGEEIPLLARMFAVVDAFDALTSKRPYRQKISTLEAVEYLREKSGVLFDQSIVDLFENIISSGQAADLLNTE
ncbi:MAG: HD domain-containing protein [Chloroflexi bacterium]|nr:HD domain-containing protein [Chloroflexota bacterium]